ncbi:hypothetical protein Rhal01_02241 [Rubritalea halochordaticola]|uniref:Ice-binding protein C-terminal domain-containing protein n=2 Tax=Rubritalea halochordaticola TaxID=714537 RepID=A0ABP9V239_9BACT
MKMNNLILMTVLGLSSGANAAISLVNGDFEDGTVTTGWDAFGGTGNAETTDPILGSQSVVSTNSTFAQDFSDANDVFNFQLDFAVRLTSVNSTQRIRLRGDNNSGDLITMRLSSGGIDTFSGAWGQRVAESITAGTDYFVRIIGTDLDTGARAYTVGISTDGVTYNTGAETTAFHSAGVGTSFETIVLDSSSGGAVWDGVSVTAVPEPSGAALIGLAGLGFILRRRR